MRIPSGSARITTPSTTSPLTKGFIGSIESRSSSMSCGAAGSGCSVVKLLPSVIHEFQFTTLDALGAILAHSMFDTGWRPAPAPPQCRKPPGGDLFSHTLASAVSSALRRFTSVFGMGTGGSVSLEPPRGLCCFVLRQGWSEPALFCTSIQSRFQLVNGDRPPKSTI